MEIKEDSLGSSGCRAPLPGWLCCTTGPWLSAGSARTLQVVRLWPDLVALQQRPQAEALVSLPSCSVLCCVQSGIAAVSSPITIPICPKKFSRTLLCCDNLQCHQRCTCWRLDCTVSTWEVLEESHTLHQVNQGRLKFGRKKPGLHVLLNFSFSTANAQSLQMWTLSKKEAGAESFSRSLRCI